MKNELRLEIRTEPRRDEQTLDEQLNDRINKLMNIQVLNPKEARLDELELLRHWIVSKTIDHMEEEDVRVRQGMAIALAWIAGYEETRTWFINNISMEGE